MTDESSLLTKLLSGAASATEGVRDRITQAAVDQISDFGVRRFTVDELARRVGLSRVTIYRHFPSKDEVLQAALLHELKIFMTDVEAAVAEYETVEERVVECFVFAVSHLRQHVMLQRLVRTEPELMLPMLTTRGGPVLATGREFIERFSVDAAQQEGTQLVQPHLSILSEMLARLILSLMVTQDSVAELQSEAELRAFADRYVGAMVRAFAATPA